jgi:hypothetical protein
MLCYSYNNITLPVTHSFRRTGFGQRAAERIEHKHKHPETTAMTRPLLDLPFGIRHFW